MRAVDHLVRELTRIGVDHLFGVGGANIEDLYDAVHASGHGIRGVVAKHEFAAATMADGYARATGRLGVVAATSGGGAMNLVPGLAEAYASRVPVLALVGQPPTALEGRGAFQDSSGRAGSLDARRVFAPVSRFCAKVDDPDALVTLLPRAIAAAQADPKGPAVLLLPKDVQQAVVRAVDSGGAPVRPGPLSAVDPAAPVRPMPAVDPATPGRPMSAVDPAALERAVAALRVAGRVLLIAGEGVATAGARAELAELARRLGAWVAVTPDAKDVFDNADPRFAGVAGVMGHRNVDDCLRRADVCVLVGTRLPVMARGGLDEALAGTVVIGVDPEPSFVPGIDLCGPLRGTLRALADAHDPHPRPCPTHAGPVPLPPPGPAGGGDGRAISYADAIAAVGAALPPDAHVFVDAGNTGAAAIHLLPAPPRGRFVVAVGMGGMGYAFGAGIGAALATGRRTYVLAGDGAFFMHGMELHTALEYGAPVTFVVFNNNAHGMCVTRERLFYADAYSYNLFRPADLAGGMAAAFPTLDATGARDATGLRRALLRTNRGGGPAFVTVECDPHEVPPFRPFLTGTGSGEEPIDSEEMRGERRRVHVG